MCALEFAIAEAPLAVFAANIGFAIETEAAQPLLFPVASPEEVVLHGPDAGRVVAVLKVDDLRMAVMHGGDVCQLDRKGFGCRLPADDRFAGDRHRDIVIGVQLGVGRPVLLVDRMVPSAFEPVDRLKFDQPLEVGHPVGFTHVRSASRWTTGSVPGLTYCMSWGMPSVKSRDLGSDSLTQSV